MSDRLTLVVFKDHLSSRTLTVRLAWLRAFGLALLSVIGLAVVAGSLFLNAYRKTITSGSLGDSRKAAELEKELADMKSSYESVKEQALSHAAGGNALGGAAQLFTSLPADAVLEALPARESLPFRLEALKASWRGGTLQIHSAIEYSRDDGGNQQGHFILMVRGPRSVQAYPDGVFASSGSPNLMKPDAGEFFSVSRYREINADFGPFAKRDDAQGIEIYVFDIRKRLIYFDHVGLESGTAKRDATHAIPPKASETDKDTEEQKDHATVAPALKEATPAKDAAPAKAAAPGTMAPAVKEPAPAPKPRPKPAPRAVKAPPKEAPAADTAAPAAKSDAAPAATPAAAPKDAPAEGGEE